ncbi:MFS transporter [Robinsoniella peoriensis]|uniref:Drug efflux system protein MdtG n=1 Tax=Robinsoniella peoriensis TaxID=180332 RepID=A0A4U8Q9E2_9FIRM|nr:MFS transporter [Robinsoniella peoriensis]MDU7030554.1 MFS transporter [Clostridiales bacterium]TLC98425.1 drug efflux system protein MdtG [Robinsoniella peoriensis]
MTRSKKYVFVIALGVLFILGFEAGGFQMSLLEMSIEFKLSNKNSGVLVAAQQSAVILVPVLFGKVADSIGKKKILFGACITFSVGCFLSIISPGYGILWLSIFVIGAGYSVCESMISAMLADLFHEKSSRYLNFAQCFYSFGAVISPQILKIGTKLLGWDWRTLFVICGVSFLLMATGVLYFRETPQQKMPLKKIYNIKGQVRKGINSSDIKLLLLMIGMFAYGGLEVGISYFLNTYISKEILRPEAAANVISIFWIVMIPARFLGGLLHKSKLKIMIICFGGVFAVLFCIPFVKSFWVLVILIAILGIGLGPIWSNLMSTAAQDYNENSGMATGFLSTGCGCGAVFFPVALGALSDVFGLRVVFFLLAAAAALGMVVSAAYRRKILKSRISM